jgi:hypothetical protein
MCVFHNYGLVHLTAQQLDTVRYFNMGQLIIFFMAIADLVSIDGVSKFLLYTKSGVSKFLLYTSSGRE